MLQFPDIAGPGMSAENLHDHGVHAPNAFVEFAIEHFQKMLDENGDILPFFSQRWQMDGHGEEAVIQVLPKFALPHGSFGSTLVAAMILASRGILRVPPTRSKARSSRTRNSLTWISGLISPISSRNSVPPPGQFEATRLRRHCVRKSPPLMPEKLRLQQGLGDGRAIYGLKGPLAYGTVSVEGPPPAPCPFPTPPGSAHWNGCGNDR
jgi:hypothetical protein